MRLTGVLTLSFVLAACSQQSGTPAIPLQTAGLPALAAHAGTFQTLHVFKGQGVDGAYPGGLTASPAGTLYGDTPIYDVGGGSAFAFSADGEFTTIHVFGNPKVPPYPNGLLYNGGSLYATLQGGTPRTPGCTGRVQCGVVLRLDGKGRYHFIYGFKGAPKDGETPNSSLTLLDGKFYGTTAYGGDGPCVIGGSFSTKGCGTVFEVTPSGQERILHSFQGGLDGAYPSGGALIAVNNELYGTTGSGRPHNFGTVFKVDLTGREHVLYRFKSGSDGATPQAGLLAVNGVLYGTTSRGGTGTGACPAHDLSDGCGTVFSLSATGEERVLHSFADSPSDGAVPLSSLTRYKGRIYGETSQGGSTTVCGYHSSQTNEGCGTIFELGPSGAVRILYNFTGASDGALPQGGLVAANGVLYGTTVYGGSYSCFISSSSFQGGCGTIFSFAP